MLRGIKKINAIRRDWHNGWMLLFLTVLLLPIIIFWLWWTGYVSNSVGEGSDVHSTPVSSVSIYSDTIPEPEQKNLDMSQIFTHSDLHFSFSYPAGFTTSRLSKIEGGETIVVQNLTQRAGFQIHLEVYDDQDTDITLQRLNIDISEMIVNEPREVLIGSGGNAGKGLAFIAGDSGTREVWFIFRGILYQITAPLSNDTLLQRVLATWTFQ